MFENFQDCTFGDLVQFRCFGLLWSRRDRERFLVVENFWEKFIAIDRVWRQTSYMAAFMARTKSVGFVCWSPLYWNTRQASILDRVSEKWNWWLHRWTTLPYYGKPSPVVCSLLLTNAYFVTRSKTRTDTKIAKKYKYLRRYKAMTVIIRLLLWRELTAKMTLSR